MDYARARAWVVCEMAWPYARAQGQRVVVVDDVAVAAVVVRHDMAAVDDAANGPQMKADFAAEQEYVDCDTLAEAAGRGDAAGTE